MDRKIAVDSLQEEIGTWGEATFGHDRNGRGTLNHLAREVIELLRDETPSEAADCAILLLHYAHRRGFSLYDAIVKKHGINKARLWGPPDKQGVCQHIESAPGALGGESGAV